MDVAIPRQRVTSPSSTTHTYTERIYHYGGRRADGDHRQTCGGSCVGAVFGVLLCLGGSVLLWYNEGVAVRTARSLDEAMKHLSSAGAADHSHSQRQPRPTCVASWAAGRALRHHYPQQPDRRRRDDAPLDARQSIDRPVRPVR